MTLYFNQDIRRGSFSMQVDLTLPARGTTAIFGPSGSGKSSMLRAIAGLDRYSGGIVRLGTQEWQNAAHFLPVHKRNLAYVFQEDNLFPHLSVRDNIFYGSRRSGSSPAETNAVIELLQIEDLLQRKPVHLSGGERQKVAIARALALKPELLLMDEPLAGLDQKFRDSFLPQLRSLIRTLQIPVLYVSHSADEVAQLADTLVLLEKGKPACAGAIEEMLTNPSYSLASSKNAESVIEGHVESFDAEYGLLKIGFSGGALLVGSPQLAVNQPVRIRIFAQDVSLTLDPAEMTSILNIYSAEVLDIIPCNPSQMTIILRLGSNKLLARITRKSADHLGVQKGKQLFAQIKSVAILN